MKLIKPKIYTSNPGEGLDLVVERNTARLQNKRIYCGLYKMFPLYATPHGFELEIPDDEPEYIYQ